MRNRSLVAYAARAALPLAFAAVASADVTFMSTGTPSYNAPYNPAARAVNYIHDDGTFEDGIGIGGSGSFDIIWLNRFVVQPGGETITDIQAPIGSPVDTRPYNGLPMTVLLYTDPDGGSPTNATLVTSLNTTVANANTGIINNYDIPDTLITTNDFFVAIVMRNLPGSNGFVASIDLTAPNVTNVSWAGFTLPGNSMNVNNLATIPAGQLGLIEGFGFAGNWGIRAIGVPEPASVGLLVLGGLLLARRRA